MKDMEYALRMCNKNERFKEFCELEKRLGYRFQNISLLELALTHKSVAYEVDADLEYNERLEFLGDAVLGIIICAFLYKTFPEYTEGQLSKLKSVVVSQPILALCAKELDLGNYIAFGASQNTTNGRENEANLADALEAIIASIYLDSGLKFARRFVLKILEDKIRQLAQDEIKYDYKTALQEYWQSTAHQPPVYSLIAETGPEHEKIFEVEVILGDTPYGRGVGKNKKTAEQQSAKIALEKLQHQKPSF
ncbi:TPA: ribonuclease III [Candidatus Poribacteria bacterium]|nr:ribonuclease III [Candidatus Poribacteria bacterium]